MVLHRPLTTQKENAKADDVRDIICTTWLLAKSSAYIFWTFYHCLGLYMYEDILPSTNLKLIKLSSLDFFYFHPPGVRQYGDGHGL
jgi:hypothetical protein